ncbi:oligosaccharide flippase family protein [Olivibacter ginsenosidimutans]|uniref:Oligosaccharide flippase family protein n=1 Tax=Olivibacter ginsenosidimutans TaxID=1176537 RepID=A0ABP9ASQ7_9SPHI
MAPRIRKSFFYNVVLTVFNLLVPIISFPYVSRILLAEGIGRAQFMLSFAQYFVVLSCLGIPIYGVREIAKVRHEKVLLSQTFFEILSINIISTLIISVIYIYCIHNFVFFQHFKPSYLLVGILVFFSFFNIDWFYTGLEQFKQIALRSVVIKLLSLLAIFVFIKKATDLNVYLLILVFSFLANQVWNVCLLPRFIQFPKERIILGKHWKPIFVTFGILLAGSLYLVFDTVLLGLLSNESQVGYYAAAVKLNRMVIPVITALGVVLVPRLTVAINQENTAEVANLSGRSFWFISFLAIPSMVGLAFFAPQFLLLFAGSDFAPAIFPMQILSPLVVAVGYANLFATQILLPAGKEKYYLRIVLLGGLLCVSLNFILVPMCGAIGAAIANMVTEFLITFFSYYYIKRFFAFHFPWKQAIVKCIACFVLFGLIHQLTVQLFTRDALILAVAVPSCAFVYVIYCYYIEKDTIFMELIHEQSRKLKLGKR